MKYVKCDQIAIFVIEAEVICNSNGKINLQPNRCILTHRAPLRLMLSR